VTKFFFLAVNIFSWHKNYFLAVRKTFFLQEKYLAARKKNVTASKNNFFFTRNHFLWKYLMFFEYPVLKPAYQVKY